MVNGNTEWQRHHRDFFRKSTDSLSPNDSSSRLRNSLGSKFENPNVKTSLSESTMLDAKL